MFRQPASPKHGETIIKAVAAWILLTGGIALLAAAFGWVVIITLPLLALYFIIKAARS